MHRLGLRDSEVAIGTFELYGLGCNPLRKTGRTFLTRVCPQCFEMMPTKHFKASWDRALEFTCEQHQLLLIDRCYACGSPISHMRRNLMNCNCGAGFLGLRRQQTTFNFKKLYLLLDVTDIYSTPAATFAPSRPEEINALLFCKRLQSLATLSSTPGKQRHSARFTDVFISAADMRGLDEVFENWPTGLYNFLERKLTQTNDQPSSFLMKKPLTEDGVLPSIRSAIQQWSYRRHRSLRPGKSSPALIQKRAQKTVGIKYVIQATGCSYDTALYWIESGRLGDYTATHRPDGITKYHIDKEKVQKAIQISKSTTSVKEIANSVGTSKRVIRLMAKAKMVQPISYGKASFNFRLFPAEVFELATNLLKCARLRRVLTGDQLLLTSAIERFGRRPVHDLQSFFRAVLRGEIKVNKTEGHVTRLDQLMIDCDALRDWERQTLR